jgi:hypothetical protein
MANIMLRFRLCFQMTCAALLTLAPLHAQFDPFLPKNTPRTAEGKVDLKAAAPRLANEKPDLSGVWEQYAEIDFPRFLIDISNGMPPGTLSMQPWATELVAKRRENHSIDHPGAYCLPSGIPEKNAVPAPIKMVHNPDLLVLLYESRTIFRQVFLDGRPLPKDPVPAWQGYSVGHWEGDTLVVDTRGFRDGSWLDMAGHPGTEQLHVIEKITRPTFGSLSMEITVDDPKAYTKPFTIRQNFHLMADGDLIEHICEENNKDPKHMVGK